MNVTVADPAEWSHRSPVQFFSCLNLILNAYLLYAYASVNKQKQLWEFHLVTFHMQSTYFHKLTVRLRIQFVSVSPLNIRLGQTRSLGLKVLGAENILGGQDFCFYYIF